MPSSPTSWSRLALLLLSIASALSFVPTFAPKFAPTRKFGLSLKRTHDAMRTRAHSGDASDFPEAEGNDEFEGRGTDSGTGGCWSVYNDFPLFVNQCSIQSFMFLLKSLRDPQTVLWMENFTQPAIKLKDKPEYAVPTGGSQDCRLLNYHGLHAINTTLFPTWVSYFSEMLERPEEIYIVESENKQIPDYELDISPDRLCSRILSVREQIANEFVKDLDVISQMGDNFLDSYWDAVQEMKECDDEDATGELKMEKENLMFLELSANGGGLAPSPLRKGNFDLLTLLVTQEAIHRVLNDPERQEGADAAGNRFLQDFYVSRLVSHFTGSQHYSRADDFLLELLAASPTVQVGDGSTTMIDPTKIAEVLIEARETVALEWRSQAQLMPDEHLEIKRLQLNQMLSGGTGTSFEDALRGISNPEPPPKKKTLVKELVEVRSNVQQEEAKKEKTIETEAPPMSVLWNEKGLVNMNAPGVFE
jgi:hypothetical protein